MRTLRSGKSLPDSPPVMRQHVGAMILSTETKVSTPVNTVVTPKPPESADLNNETPIKRGRGRPPKLRKTLSNVEHSPTPAKDIPVELSMGNAMKKTSSEEQLPIQSPATITLEQPKKMTQLPTKSSPRKISSIVEYKVIKEESIPILDPNELLESTTSHQQAKIELAENDGTIELLQNSVCDQPQQNNETVLKDEVDHGEKSVVPKTPRKKREVIMSPPMERLAKTEICKVCGMGFTRKATLIKHSRIHESEISEPEPTPVKKRSSFPSKSPINCELCHLTFTRKAHLDRHLLLHSGVKPFTCDICQASFSRKDHMFAHRQKHNGEVVSSCNQCGLNFTSPKSLQEHTRIEHAEPVAPPLPESHVCETCGKHFLQKRYLAAHRKLHLREIHGQINDSMNPYSQFEEDANNSDYEDLFKPLSAKAASINGNSSSTTYISKPRKPMVLINRVVKLSADLALKSLKGCNTDVEVCLEEADGEEGGADDDYEDVMDYDYETLTGIMKQFPVDGSGDVSSEDAYAPSSSHPQEMECSVCGKGYTDRAALRKHYRVHKKKFNCRFCGLRLASAGSLMRHNLIHTGKKEFQCSICYRKFSRKDTLAVHLTAHEKSTTRVNMTRPYLCKICGASYTMKYNLIRHLKMCHTTSTKRPKFQIPQRMNNTLTQNNNSSQSVFSNGNFTVSAPTTAASNEKDMVISLNPFDLESLPQRFDESTGDEKPVGITFPMAHIKDEPMEIDEEANWASFENEVDDRNLDNEYQEDEQGLGGDTADGQIPGGKYVCNHCGKTFKNSKSLNTHKWYHSREKQFICPVCNRGFKYSTDLSRHLNTHTTDKGVPTTSAKPSTSTNPNIRSLPPLQHKTANQNQQRQPPRPRNINSMESRPFGCKLCPQRFNHRSNLSRHTRLLHNSTSIRKRIPNSINLQIYLKKLQAKKSGQIINNRMSQERPVEKQHQDWMPWNGGNLLNQSDNVNATLYTKDGNTNFPSADSFSVDRSSTRPFSCNVCGKAFESKNNLWTHFRIHNKAFSCNICGLKVATRGDLVLHLRTHTGEKPFSCHMCEWKFSRKSGLNKHLQKYHTPGSKVLRPWKFREDKQQSGSLKFKFIRSSPQKDDFQIQHLQSRSSGMQISKIPSVPNNSSLKAPVLMGNKPLPRLIPATERTSNNTILKSVLQRNDTVTSSQQVTVRRFLNTSMPTIRSTPSLVQKPTNTNFRLSQGQGGGAKPSVLFVCRRCGTLITGKQNYIEHMKSHQNVSIPVSAPMPSTSTNNDNQKIELKIDRKFEEIAAKPFNCELCDQRFGQKAHLTRHLLSHQNSEAARCDICGKICSSLGFLSRHYQYVHPDKFNPAEQARFRVPELDKQNNQRKNSDNPLIPEVVMDDDDEEEEEFPDESDEYPNTLQSDSSAYNPETYTQMASSSFSINESKSRVFEENETLNALQKSRPFTITRIGAEALDVPTPCERCGKEFTSKKARSDHVWYCKREKIHRCPVSDCKKEFKLKHDVVRHLKRHTNERRFSCRVCESKFYHKQDVDRHMRSVHKLVLNNNPYPCDFCEMQFGNEFDLNNHLQSAHGVDHADIATDAVGSNESDFQTEQQQGEEEEEEYEDYVLDMEYDRNYQGHDNMPDPSSFLEQSMGEATNENYDCQLCNKSFDSRQKFMYHKYYHEREAKYNCTECEEKFKLRSHLERHMRTYHNELKPVQKVLHCNQCPRKFTREYDLNTHIHKVHLNVSVSPPPHPLSILKTTLVKNTNDISENDSKSKRPLTQSPELYKDESSVDYDDQEIIIAGQQCNRTLNDGSHPNKVWSTSDEMRVMGMKDSVTQNSDGQYSCDLCGKVFSEKKSADAHRYYHNREEKYLCTSCGARFKQNSDLQRHVRIHHNSKNPKSTIHCPHCYRSFTDDRYMRMHIRRYHSDKNQQGGSTESMSLEGNENTLRSDGPSNQWQNKDNHQPFIKEEPMDDDYENSNGTDTGVWNTDENFVDLTIVENDNEEERSLVIQSWGSSPLVESEGENETEDHQNYIEEIEYTNSKDDANVDSNSTGGAKGQCSVTCGSCNAGFENTSAIQKHICPSRGKPNVIKKSTGTSFDCTLCGAQFSRSNELILHGRIHTGVKPFSCSDCGKNFVQRADLNAHLLTVHNKNMEVYDCPFCPKKFFVRKSLDSHKRRHHGNIIQFWNCGKCGRQFLAQKFLEAHEKNCP